MRGFETQFVLFSPDPPYWIFSFMTKSVFRDILLKSLIRIFFSMLIRFLASCGTCTLSAAHLWPVFYLLEPASLNSSSYSLLSTRINSTISSGSCSWSSSFWSSPALRSPLSWSTFSYVERITTGGGGEEILIMNKTLAESDQLKISLDLEIRIWGMWGGGGEDIHNPR